MGYYSTIGIVIEESHTELFLKELKYEINENYKNDNQLKSEINEFLRDSVSYFNKDKKGDMLIYVESIKWNNSRDMEQLIISTLFKLGESNFRFIRLGEDYDDNELIGDYYTNQFGMDWHREITFENLKDYPEERFKLFD